VCTTGRTPWACRTRAAAACSSPAWPGGVPEQPARMMPLRVSSFMPPIRALRRSWPTSPDKRRFARVRHPVAMAQVPLHRLADAGLERLGRAQALFALNLARIDSVAPVAARPILHVGDELGAAVHGLPGGGAGHASCCGWRQLVQQRARRVHDLQVGLLVPATDVVDLAQAATR
jgi:hypothetical protein